MAADDVFIENVHSVMTKQTLHICIFHEYLKILKEHDDYINKTIKML